MLKGDLDALNGLQKDAFWVVTGDLDASNGQQQNGLFGAPGAVDAVNGLHIAVPRYIPPDTYTLQSVATVALV